MDCAGCLAFVFRSSNDVESCAERELEQTAECAMGCVFGLKDLAQGESVPFKNKPDVIDYTIFIIRRRKQPMHFG